MEQEQKEWLQEALNKGAGELTDADLNELLGDASLSDQDLEVTIQFVETWLSKRACGHLLLLAMSSGRPHSIRERAARALVQIIDEDSLIILKRAIFHR